MNANERQAYRATTNVVHRLADWIGAKRAHAAAAVIVAAIIVAALIYI